MLQKLISDLQMTTFGPVQVVANLLVALVLALITTYVYRKTHSGYAYSRSFNMTMVSVTMVVTMMMMVIGNYLALSLGLIGALSVIRFRSAIKDSKDMAFLFICIAIGLACSTGDYIIAVTGTLVINIAILGLHFLRFGSVMDTDHILSFTLPGKKNIDKMIEKIRERFPGINFRSFSQISEDECEYVYSIKLGKMSEEDALEFIKKEMPDISHLSLLAPDTNIEL